MLKGEEKGFLRLSKPSQREEATGSRPRWHGRSTCRRKRLSGSQLESNKKAMTIRCKVCMQTFMCTTTEVKCGEHAEAKHPKSDVYACFPHLKK